MWMQLFRKRLKYTLNCTEIQNFDLDILISSANQATTYQSLQALAASHLDPQPQNDLDQSS